MESNCQCVTYPQVCIMINKLKYVKTKYSCKFADGSMWLQIN